MLWARAAGNWQTTPKALPNTVLVCSEKVSGSADQPACAAMPAMTSCAWTPVIWTSCQTCAACTDSHNSLAQSSPKQWPVMSSPGVAGVTCKVQPHMHWPSKQLLCHHLLSTYLPTPTPANPTVHGPHWAATGSQSVVTFAHLLLVAALLLNAKAAHLRWLVHQLLRPHPYFCAAAGWRSGCCEAL